MRPFPAIHHVDTARTAIGPAPAESIAQLDELGSALCVAAEGITAPMARAARTVVEREIWKPAGYVNVDCYAKERLDRSGRWLRELARLGVALERFPDLAGALPEIGCSRALLITPLLDESHAAEWIDRAKALTTRALREAILQRGLDARVDRDRVEPRSEVRIDAWPGVRDALDETLDLGRAVLGHQATAASVVDAMLAEAASGSEGLRLEAPAPAPAIDCYAVSEQRRERQCEERTASWAEFRRGDLTRAGRHATDTLERVARLAAMNVGALPPYQLEQHLRALIIVEDQVLRRIGEVLAELAEKGSWRKLGFAGLGHYAVERLDLARTTAEDRAFVARSLRRLPLLRSAYADGRIPFEKTLTIVRVLGNAPATREVEQAWLERAQDTTLKRLRDEARALTRHTENRARAGERVPLDDADWYATLERKPGDARVRVIAAGLSVLEAVNVGARPEFPVRLRLPSSVATRFVAAIEARRAELEREVREGADPGDRVRPSLDAARVCYGRLRRVPSALGLLSLIEDTVAAWDPVRPVQRGARARRVYERAGYRCEVPGCTNRDGIEWHHIEHRSVGGENGEANGGARCAGHHRHGEHDGSIRSTGTAPLGVTFRLGEGPFATWYRNERVISDN